MVLHADMVHTYPPTSIEARKIIVWVAGFEPTTSPVRGERPTKLAYTQSHCPQCSTSIGVAATALIVPHIRISRPVTRSVNNASIRFPPRSRLQRL